MKQPLLSKSDGVNIAVSIKDCEGITMQQDASSIIGERRLSPNIELILDLDDVSVGHLREFHSEGKLEFQPHKEYLPTRNLLITVSWLWNPETSCMSTHVMPM